MALSPSRRVPPEIIHDIFSYLSSYPLRVHEADEFPWYLGHICSEWRSIFLSMRPYFWDEIQMEWRGDYEEEEDYAHAVTILDFFLRTIGGAPFSFTLCWDRGYGGEKWVSTRLVLERLLDHSKQWKNVSMTLYEPEMVMLQSAKGRLPLLQKLQLHVSIDEEDVLYPPPCDLFSTAPLLPHIEFGCFSRHVCQFNWSTLASICIRYTSPTTNLIISALRQAINLEELMIDNEFSNSELVNVGIIKLPHLKHLALESPNFLNVLEAPTLKKLEMEFQLEYYNTDSPDLALSESDEWSIITTFIIRSNCDLSTFIARRIGSIALKEILSYMPNLEELSLCGILSWKKVIIWLTRPELRLRRLNKLAVYALRFKDHELITVHRMISHRTTGPKVLHIENIARRLQQAITSSESAALDTLESLCKDKGVCLTLCLPPLQVQQRLRRH